MELRESSHETEQKLLKSLYRYEDHALREGLRALGEREAPPLPGMMFLYFDYDGDPRGGRFLNPLDVVPNLKTDVKYQLDMQLLTLHVDELIDSLHLSKEKPLEQRLYTSVPASTGDRRDWLDWIVTSAIDVFGEQSRDGRDKKLQAFGSSDTPTSTLRDSEKILVQKGVVRLGQGIWGHKRKNAFIQFWGWMTKAFSSPLVAAAGLPALLPAASLFVNKILQDYEKDNEIRTLWKTKMLDFNVAPGAGGDFNLKSGVWVVIGTDYVRQNPNLEKHMVDFQHESFEILGPDEKPIDSAYLVSKITLEET